jgi:hypothetical protein
MPYYGITGETAHLFFQRHLGRRPAHETGGLVDHEVSQSLHQVRVYVARLGVVSSHAVLAHKGPAVVWWVAWNDTMLRTCSC